MGTEEDLDAQLEAAVQDDVDASPTNDDEVKEPQVVEKSVETKPRTQKENMVPQSRVNEIAAQRREAEERTAALEAQLDEAQRSLIKMTDLLEAKTQDADILDRIRDLASDPTMEAHLKAIDNKLKGVQEEVESGDITPEEGNRKALELINKQNAQIDDLRAESLANDLINRADQIADKLLGSLPEEYTDQDIDIIGDLWADQVDWDEAATNPDNLSTILSDSLQKTLDRYGVPRGALISPDDVEVVDDDTSASKQLEPEEELAALMGKNWGNTKTVKTPSGKERVEAELSDDDFSAAMATAMRLAKRSRA